MQTKMGLPYSLLEADFRSMLPFFGLGAHIGLLLETILYGTSKNSATKHTAETARQFRP